MAGGRAPDGTLMKKIHSQPSAEVIEPPRARRPWSRTRPTRPRLQRPVALGALPEGGRQIESATEPVKVTVIDGTAERSRRTMARSTPQSYRSARSSTKRRRSPSYGSSSGPGGEFRFYEQSVHGTRSPRAARARST